MIHIAVFIFFGWFDLRMDRYGIAGNLAIVAFRLAAATAAATVLWYGFESQILKLKRFFRTSSAPESSPSDPQPLPPPDNHKHRQ
jgi:peptidoglycan/LPS O-acetylase OafA/YrhL